MNKIALAPTSLPNTPPLEYIDAAARAGYDGIGIRFYRSPGSTFGFFPVAGEEALTGQVRQAIASSGLEVYDVLSFYLQPEMDFESMRPPLELGAEVGARYALVIGDDPDWGRMVENFGRFCDMAAEYSLTASIEAPVSQRQVNTLEKALGLIRESGRENAVICLDPYHFFRTGHTAAAIKAADARLFPYTQIDDGTTEVAPPGGRCAPGEGAVPLDDIFDALPPELPLSLEWSAPRGSGYAAVDWAKIALETTRRYLDGYYTRGKQGSRS